MSRARHSSVLLILVAILFATWGGSQSPAAPGSGGPHAFVPGEILVKFKPTAKGLDIASARAQLNAVRLHTFRTGGEHWKLGAGQSVEQGLDRMKRNPHVLYAGPNYILTADVTPNDTRYSELYGMNNTGQTGGTADADIDADLAWGVSRGSRSVLVGIIDTGVDYNHPDLSANIWTNPGEIPGNSVDDDNNGFIDDVHGYDFVNNDGDPFDDNGHGTHCAGTIGAVGNNGTGVVGVNWEVSIMGLKFLSAGGSGSTANAVRAVEYATMMGVDLTSNSWGGGGADQFLAAAIAEAGAAEIPFIAAAGNNGTNNDTTAHYPSSYDLANVISVAATDHNDAVASFSNYGAVSVDIAAPGVAILSTQPGGGYQLLSGTSMATPHVAGVAALIKSRFPNIPAAQLKFALMNFADQKPQLHPVTGTRPIASGGRVNAFFSIADPDQDAPGSIADLSTVNPASNSMGLQWTATGDDGGTGTATFYHVRYSTSPIDENNFAAATRAGNEPNPVASGGAQSMEVLGLAAGTPYYFAVKAFDEWGNGGPISNVAAGTTLPPPTAGYDPSSITDALFTGGQSDHVVTLRNDGVGTLDFTIPTPSVSTPLSVYPDLPLDKDEPDPRPGILGAGGPDASGYRWVDSDDAGGPVFSWVEISGIGTPLPTLNGDDQIATNVPIGFPFNFYNSTFTTVNVSTNGWFSFTNTTPSGSLTYSNQPLPNSGGPENLVAPFWDDLDFRGATHAYYYNDGSRFIVQWNDVDRHPAEAPDPDHLTFQAILYPTGAVVYQYLTTNGKVDSTTVGIQNATKSDGLTVVYNSAYLHDNLAVEFSRVPQWLTASPVSGRLTAGASMPINVHMDAAGLEGGTYPGAVNILTNDPLRPTLNVSVTLNVTGAPDATVTPASIGFGDVFLGLPFQRTLNVANAGTDVLHVTAVDTSDGQLAAAPASFDLAPRFGQTVTLTLTAAALGPYAGSVTIHSDDASEPAITIPVTANVIPAPVVVVTPASLTETLFSGNSAQQTVNVSNTGGSNLIVTASADQGAGGTGITSTDPGILGQGGPDAFGYKWRDSDAPGGPAFNFIDISATGTAITFSSLDDSVSATIPMGMSFPFYGTSFSSLKVSSNGWITFDPNTTASAATNGTMPSTSLGRSAIAMFWDDLHLRAAGRVRYLNDGTRFIVQYTNVDKFSPSGASLTFQAQLYPNGKILLMYQTMTGTLTSATIGVQNQARTVALQVVNNAAYMHNNLALQISRTPDWLSVTPAGATVPPGESRNFIVTFDATDRPGGTLSGNVVLGTNVPGQTTILVPATLNVIGAPNVRTAPASFNYGTVFVGYPQLTSFQVINDGTDVLNVSDVDTTDPALTVEDLPGPTAGFTLAPGASRIMNLRWSPASAGSLSAAVRVHSDDPDSPITSIAITGNALMPPIAQHSPASFTESLDAGDIVTRNLHVENQGGSNLTVNTSIRLLSGSPVPVYGEMELKKDEPDPRPGILGSGGPDLFGYRWTDSDAPGGPAFAWTDISGIGTPLTSLDGDDEIALNTPIGFTFPYYGNTFSTVNVNTNGWLSFTNTTAGGSAAYTNQPMPNSGTGVPENLIAAFWDDLDFRGAVHAYYHNDGTRFIVQWNDVDRHPTTAPSPAHLTFQVILYPNGRIVLQYLGMTGVLNEATIGQQNATRNDGLQMAFNAGYVHGNLAIEVRPPVDYLSLSPTGGTIPPGGSLDISVRIDASNLIGGDYAAGIDLLTNDPANGLIPVPVNLHVTGIPDIDLQPASLTFPTTYLGFGSTRTFNLSNTGTDVLTITGISASGDFTASGPSLPLSLAVGGSVTVPVLFTPTVPGPRAGDITVTSNDPDEGTATVTLEGAALLAPEIGVAPSFITTALPPGGTRTKTLTLGNTGGSDLVWTTGTEIISAVTPGTFVALGKDEVDTRAGILGSGGPDAFGYRWQDSDEPGGPVFAWTDISGIGTPISGLTGDDAIALNIPIGFPFSYYGSTFTTLNVHTNGWMSFTNTVATGSATYTNQPLPNNGTGVPENLLAAFWDDLHFRGAVHASYYNDGSRFIVQYTNVDRFSTTEQPSPAHLTFQVILYPSGKIVYQYLTLNAFLTSASVGMQNGARDDGLTVVFNAAYLHDNLAVEFRPIPEWVQVNPTGGTIPAGGTQQLTVSLNAAGLDDGLHEASIDVSSNDPYTPLLSVPVSLNVGLVAPTMVAFDPDVLNLQSNGRCVKVVIELPAGLDPHQIDLSSLRLNDTVAYPPNPCGDPSFGDSDNDGLEEISVKFDRQEVEALFSGMPAGNNTLTVQGEVADVQWFRGSTTIRTFRPSNIEPMGGEYLVSGQQVQIRWTPPASLPGQARFDVQLTRDGGVTWESVASGLTSSSYDWTVDGAPTSQARVRVVVLDNQGVMGYATSDGDFTISAAMMPPNDVGSTLEVFASATDAMLKWERPGTDVAHGPVGFYRVMRSLSAQGPFVEIGTTTTESFSDPMDGTAGAEIVYYKVFAANSSGNSAD